MIRVGRLVGFYTAYLIFGSVGVLTSLMALPIAHAFGSSKANILGQRLIHYLFRFFVWYLHACGLVQLQANELKRLRFNKNLILVANHPSLLDVVFVAACVPNVFCLMKADLLSNVVLCGQATLAGYVHNKSGVGLIKACKVRLHQGSNLLIFPEGTRSNGELGSFKLGFALLSRMTQAPVQTIVIRYSNRYLGKGWPFFRPPPFPIHCSIQLGVCFRPTPQNDDRTFGRSVECYFREALNGRQEALRSVLVHE
jgi:1-acyl-sn-glycerol-3-phosphate acyltransferase